MAAGLRAKQAGASQLVSQLASQPRRPAIRAIPRASSEQLTNTRTVRPAMLVAGQDSAVHHVSNNPTTTRAKPAQLAGNSMPNSNSASKMVGSTAVGSVANRIMGPALRRWRLSRKRVVLAWVVLAGTGSGTVRACLRRSAANSMGRGPGREGLGFTMRSVSQRRLWVHDSGCPACAEARAVRWQIVLTPIRPKVVRRPAGSPIDLMELTNGQSCQA